MNAGVLYMQLEKVQDGARNITAAYRLDSTENRIVLNYATLLAQQGRYEECLRLIDEILDRGYKRFLAYFYGARASLELGRYGKAMNYLEQAANLADNRNAAAMVQRLADEILQRQAQPGTGSSE
jgi:pentatricopeptide repeat protein